MELHTMQLNVNTYKMNWSRVSKIVCMSAEGGGVCSVVISGMHMHRPGGVHGSAAVTIISEFSARNHRRLQIVASSVVSGSLVSLAAALWEFRQKSRMIRRSEILVARVAAALRRKSRAVIQRITTVVEHITTALRVVWEFPMLLLLL